RTLRDLVARSAVPAIRVSYEPRQVAASLADVPLEAGPGRRTLRGDRPGGLRPRRLPTDINGSSSREAGLWGLVLRLGRGGDDPIEMAAGAPRRCLQIVEERGDRSAAFGRLVVEPAGEALQVGGALRQLPDAAVLDQTQTPLDGAEEVVGVPEFGMGL